MSFGYSIGDFIAGANLTYQVIHALSSSKGASIEYQEAINELGCMQQTFFQVSHLKRSHALCPATINALSHLVISSVEIIGKFLERTKLYQRRLSENHGGMAGSWQKVGWTLFKKDELMRLRDTLHRRLNAVGILLSAAQAQSMMPSGGEYQIGTDASIEPRSSPPTPAAAFALAAPPAYAPAPATDLPPPAAPPSPPDTSKDDEKFARLEKLLMDQKTEQLAREAAVARKAREKAVARKAEEEREMKEAAKKKKPVEFKDAIGRKFSFPYHLCKTWAGMEGLITQAFLHVDIIGAHVVEGHYDLVGPNGEIILPQVWDTTIEPDWTVTMHMWPMPEPPQPEDSQPEPPQLEDPQPTGNPSNLSGTPGLLRSLMGRLRSF